MAIVDIFEIVHQVTYYGKPMLNTYHVERANTGELSGAISDAFQNSILPKIRALQSNSVVNDELRIFNLGTSTDFGTFTLSGSFGLRAGARSPSFISAGVRFPTLDREIRAGSKRFPGMLETDYTAGVMVVGTQGLVDDIGDAMVSGWLASADAHLVCNYIVLGRVCKTFDPTDPDKCIQYRLPKTDAELKRYQPSQHIDNNEITSQVSRKVF